jgi:hypothetical protein
MTTRRNHYQGEVDYFAVYSPDTRKVYLLPISDVGNTENCLRLVPTGNGQERKVKYAADYEPREILARLFDRFTVSLEQGNKQDLGIPGE